MKNENSYVKKIIYSLIVFLVLITAYFAYVLLTDDPVFKTVYVESEVYNMKDGEWIQIYNMYNWVSAQKNTAKTEIWHNDELFSTYIKTSDTFYYLEHKEELYFYVPLLKESFIKKIIKKIQKYIFFWKKPVLTKDSETGEKAYVYLIEDKDRKSKMRYYTKDDFYKKKPYKIVDYIGKNNGGYKSKIISRCFYDRDISDSLFILPPDIEFVPPPPNGEFKFN